MKTRSEVVSFLNKLNKFDSLKYERDSLLELFKLKKTKYCASIGFELEDPKIYWYKTKELNDLLNRKSLGTPKVIDFMEVFEAADKESQEILTYHLDLFLR